MQFATRYYRNTHLLGAAVALGSELKEVVSLTNACDFGQTCSFGLRGLCTAWHQWYCNRQRAPSWYHATHRAACQHVYLHTMQYKYNKASTFVNLECSEFQHLSSPNLTFRRLTSTIVGVPHR